MARRIGIGIVLIFGLAALLAPWIAPYDPYERVDQPFLPPGPDHWLGTNDVGQDILSELLAGARVTLFVSAVVGGLATLIGTLLGLLSGLAAPACGPVPPSAFGGG